MPGKQVGGVFILAIDPQQLGIRPGLLRTPEQFRTPQLRNAVAAHYQWSSDDAWEETDAEARATLRAITSPAWIRP